MKKVLDSKSLSEEIIPKIISFEQYKNPSKDMKWIQTYLSRKITSKDDRKMFKEVISDYSSFPSTDKPKKKVVDGGTVSEKISDYSSFPSTDKKTGSKSKLDAVLESILSDKEEKKASKGKDKTVSFQGPLIGQEKKKTKGTDYTSILEGSGKYITDNKETINKLKKALTKENIDSGAWFTQLGSLSVPELAVVQEILKNTPLGMSKIDNENLDKILSKDGSVSNSEGIKTILKSLINPDAVGKIISTQGSKAVNKAGEGLSDFWSKLTTGKGLVAPKEQGVTDTENLIKSRRSVLEAQAKRKKDLADLGIFTDYEDSINSGYSNLTAEQIAKRPELALQQTTASDDFFTGLQNLFLPTGGRSETLNTPEKMRAYLAKNDPQRLADFDSQVSKYDQRIKKVNLSSDSAVDPTLHGDILKRITDYNRALIKKASSIKALTNQEIEQIYDINATLEDVMTGKQKLSYSDLDSAVNSIVGITPSSVLNDISLNSPALIAELRAKLGMSFRGDSDLSTADKLLSEKTKPGIKDKPEDKTKPEDKPPGPEEPPKDPPPDGTVKEVPLDNSNNRDDIDEEPNTWSELKPRQVAGGTDQELMPSEEDDANALLFWQAQSIEAPGWGRDGGEQNMLYQRNLDDYNLQYAKTFAPPPVEPEYIPKFNREYLEHFKPVWLAKDQPSPLEMGGAFERYGYGYNQEHIGKFQSFAPKYQDTSSNALFRYRTPYSFPDEANQFNPEPFRFTSQFNYIENQRFIGRR
jgi:hypothetical protein